MRTIQGINIDIILAVKSVFASTCIETPLVYEDHIMFLQKALPKGGISLAYERCEFGFANSSDDVGENQGSPFLMFKISLRQKKLFTDFLATFKQTLAKPQIHYVSKHSLLNEACTTATATYRSPS